MESRDTTALVRCYHIGKKFRHGPEIFTDATVFVPAGGVFSLSGPSGAGKSVFVKLLIGIEQPDQGQIWVEDRNLRHLSAMESARLRRRIGVIPQETRLIMDETVGANVALPLEINGMDRSLRLRKVHSILRSVGLEYRDTALCSRLSASERKLVAIARAAVRDPFLLIADDPFPGLDDQAVRRTIETLKRLSVSGTTLIVTGRNDVLREAFPGCRSSVIRGGAIVED